MKKTLLLFICLLACSFSNYITAAGISGLAPSTGLRGQDLTVMISATGVNFQQGSGTAGVWFSQGSETINAYNVDVISATQLAASFDLSYHTCGAYSTNVYTNSTGTFTSPGSFTVNCSNGQLSSVSPSTVYRGSTVQVEITGTGTHFDLVSGSSTLNVNFTQGSSTIYPFSINSASATKIIAEIFVDSWSNCGAYSTNVYSGIDGTLVLPNSLTVDCNTATISGAIYLDKNKNGTRDNGEPGIPNQQVVLDPQTAGAPNIIVFTNYFGYYEAIGGYDNYLVTTIPSVSNYTIQGTSQYTIVANAGNPLAEFNDFAYSATSPVHDAAIDLQASTAVAGFSQHYWLTYFNNGSETENATISFTAPNGFTYLSSYPQYTTKSGNIYSWTVNGLDPFELDFIRLELKVPVSSFGETIQPVASIQIATTDINTADNNDTLESVVVGSYDPNDKQVKPAGVQSSNYILMNEQLQYTIRFQNTGTYYATYVRVEDVLDAKLDFKTFKFASSSHTCTYTFDEKTRKLVFYFNNINLPDSTTDLEGSQGFVSFSINPVANLPEKSKVNNTADIYFDFNPAVVTNTVMNTYVTEIPVGIHEVKPGLDFTIKTIDASKGRFEVAFDAVGESSLVVQSIDGKVVFNAKSYKSGSLITLEGNAAGLYLFKLTSNNKSAVKKVIKN